MRNYTITARYELEERKKHILEGISRQRRGKVLKWNEHPGYFFVLLKQNNFSRSIEI